MFKGELTLSRARGAKAQRRLAHNQLPVENTINFNQAVKSHRHVEIIPKSRGQEQLVLDLRNPNNAISIVSGPAGTGKTYLIMLSAIKALKTGQIDKLILTRPAVEVDEEKHGFLPGDLNSKMEPWTRPLLDILKEFYTPRDIAKMLEDGVIEISPLAFMRGRTFRNAWVIADEMQNATPSQMKMLLTRIGEGSKIVVNGDVEQTDRKANNNGLLDIISKLKSKNIRGLSTCVLSAKDIQRHPIIGDLLTLYT